MAIPVPESRLNMIRFLFNKKKSLQMQAPSVLLFVAYFIPLALPHPLQE